MAKKQLTIEEKLEAALVPVEEQPYTVPENWCWVRLSALLRELKNGTTIKQDKNGIGYKVTRIESLQQQTIDFDRLGNIVDKNKIKENDWYEAGDVALSHINSAEHVGKTAVIQENMLPLVHGMNLLRLRFNDLCQPILFQLFSRSYQYKSEIRARINMAVNQVSINQKNLGTVEFPLPPINEQSRIVARIESLFAKLDEAKEKIQEVLDGADLRRAAILHQAFTGKFTDKWRKENSVGDESWKITSLGNICHINPKKIDTTNLDDNMEVSFIPMADVSDISGDVIGNQIRPLGEVKKGFTNFNEGDVVFAKITPCMENGKSAIIGKLKNDVGYGTTEFYVLRPKDVLYNRYVYHLVRSKFFRDKAKSNMTGAVGQQRVPKKFMQEYEINLPSMPEQKEIVRLLDSLLSCEQSTVTACEEALTTIETLKKSILARAFRGELGTNDPAEPNAKELLKDILSA